MKILFIGGTGILSTDIVKLCIKKGHEVYIINRGHNNKELEQNVKFIIVDINKSEEVKKKVSGMYFDVVIDFLSYTESQLRSKLQIFNNNCSQYIFISSATVYRKTKKGEKITETTEANNVEWEYSLDKIKCEETLRKNYKECEQKYTIIRPYVTYSEKRIPYAIIPFQNWTLANRILNNKPIVLWDGGKATCTLTQTKDFAVGIVGLFLKEEAYGQAFHITSDNTLTWKEATQCIENALNKKAIIVEIPSEYIIEKMPEYKGVLRSDKGIDREFDNSKIKSVVPEFDAKIKFEDGIKETVEYYKNNLSKQTIDYLWDGRIDNLIKKYYKKNKIPYEKISLTTKAYKEKLTIINKTKYYIGKNVVLYRMLSIIRKLV
ncbi:MAG: NAD-dependent epimerase/dehydratase family protein [Clostridia bacterium]|jgi:nucleoside-diphosphate-sugar epimerase|nr:NAD-dependent epimerase/dehydratase family protein [Clostridia bacterium]